MPQTALTGQDKVGETYAGAQFAPAGAALTGGGYVIAWLDLERDAIFAQRYDAAGQRIGTEFQVSTPGSVPLFASIAALADGGFVVAWQDGSFSSADIHARRYDAGGSPVGAEFTVNSSLVDEQLDVRVIGLESGGFAFAWDTIAGDQYQEVSGRIYNAAGTPLGPDFTLNTTTADSQGISSIAPLAGGGFVATWQSVTPAGGGNVEIFGQRFAGDGTRIGSEFQVNTATANNQRGNDVARLSDGSFVVTWIDPVPGNGGGRVVARHYDANGTPRGGEIVIASKTTGGFDSSAVTALADGAYLVTWTDDDSADNNVSARAMGANDAPLGSAFDVSSGSVFDSKLYPDGAITLANGRVVFTWDGPSTNTSQDVYHRMFAIGTTQPYFEGDSGNNAIPGTGADDYFDLSQGGNDTANGNGGDDAFFFGAAFSGADTVDGGAGSNDQIGLRGSYTGANALVLGAGTIANVEVIAVLPGFDYAITTVDANVPAGGTLKVYAGNLGAGDDFTFNGAAETNGKFMVYGGGGTDLITTGAGNDGIYFGPGKFNPAVDRINGGGGTNDQLALDGDYTVTLDGTAIQNVEVVALLRGVTGDLADYNLTLANSLTGAGKTMTIWGVPLETALTVNGAAESDGKLKIYGGTLGDTLVGGSGDDWFWGGLGGDSMTGGNGADTFMYESVAQSTAGGFDRLVGFSQVLDRIDLPTGVSVSGFAAPAAGTLNAGSLGSDLEAQAGALGVGQAMVFDASGGDLNGHKFLLVDANGTAGYQASGDFLFELVSPQSPIDSSAMFV